MIVFTLNDTAGYRMIYRLIKAYAKNDLTFFYSPDSAVILIITVANWVAL